MKRSKFTLIESEARLRASGCQIMRSRMIEKPTRARFTLIELLIVISILFILMGLILGAFGLVRKKSRRAVCSSNLRQLGLAVHLYVNDYRDRLPVSERLAIHNHLEAYTSGAEIYQCPGDLEDDGLFATEGTSYEWNVFVNGKLIDRSNFQILGLDLQLPLMYDGDYYHGKQKNQLFNDGRIEVYEPIDGLLEE
ncbi:MAG: type II secretion system protein [Lentisphaeria bacterium]|nr:type II secretion system GspH family protein [Lentisphaeria bacterium]NQZ71174.1 type II secretion system protein [Lentisphaeria bacterium]